MRDFVEDVMQIEKYIDGNINIFDQFLKAIEKNEIIKRTKEDLFITNKEKKKRDKKR